MRLTVPRRGGWRAWGAVRADFERALADPVDPAIASAEIASELRRGADYVRVTVALTVAATDVADALAIAWDAFRGAAQDDPAGWEVAAAAAQVQPEPLLTGASGHPDRRSFTCRLTLQSELPCLSVCLRGLAASSAASSPWTTIRSDAAGALDAVKGDDVASALACVGLAVSDKAELGWLVTSAHRAARETGVFDGVHVGRWKDDSGAVLVLGWRPGELLDFISAYAAASSGLLSECHLINESVTAAAVVDADGPQLTAMAFEAEQYRHLRTLRRRVSGPARITALGISGRSTPTRTPSPPPRQPARPLRRPRPGTPAALPRERLVRVVTAGRRIVHLLRRLRRPRPGPAARPPVRHRPHSWSARLRADRAAVHRRRRPHRRIRGGHVPGRR